MTRWHFLAVTGLLALSSHANASVGETSALFTASSTSSTSSLTGATFTPRVAPVITPTVTARSISLSWPEVKSAKPVAYNVTRTGPVGTSSQVCTGANLPVTNQGTVRCLDTTATSGVSYTYSQQPLLDIANSTPWSLPASSSSSSVSAPRLSYIDSGPDASSTGPAVTVPHPASVELGDLLILIAICGVNKAPATPPGWNQIVSRGVSGSSNAYLLVAWRVADGSPAPSLDPRSNGSGTSARILNYGRFQTNSASPVVATSGVVSGSAVASATFTPSPNVVTNGANATVISIVAMSAGNSPTLTNAQSFTQRISQNLSPGSGTLGLGVADLLVVASGGSATSPTWTQSGTVKDWIYATLAFR